MPPRTPHAATLPAIRTRRLDQRIRPAADGLEYVRSLSASERSRLVTRSFCAEQAAAEANSHGTPCGWMIDTAGGVGIAKISAGGSWMAHAQTTFEDRAIYAALSVVVMAAKNVNLPPLLGPRIGLCPTSST
jgi:hypothetical protein